MNLNALEDRGRTAPPQERPLAEQVIYASTYASSFEHHKDRVMRSIVAVLAGHQNTVAVLHQGRLQALEVYELYDVLTGHIETAHMARLLAAPFDADAKSESATFAEDHIFAPLVEATADHMARIDALGELT